MLRIAVTSTVLHRLRHAPILAQVAGLAIGQKAEMAIAQSLFWWGLGRRSRTK
jgi:hypothetical protein